MSLKDKIAEIIKENKEIHEANMANLKAESEHGRARDAAEMKAFLGRILSEDVLAELIGAYERMPRRGPMVFELEIRPTGASYVLSSANSLSSGKIIDALEQELSDPWILEIILEDADIQELVRSCAREGVNVDFGVKRIEFSWPRLRIDYTKANSS